MPPLTEILASVGFFVLGIAARRVALLPAAAAWPVYFLGLEQGWWGSGVGDGWEYGLLGATALAVAGAALGLGAGSLLRR